MPRKPVVTVSKDDLPGVALQLFNSMVRGGFQPDAVVGIANGGLRVVEALPASLPVVVLSCSTRRPSTAVKERAGLKSGVLRYLPYWVTDRLRLLEDRAGARKPVQSIPASARLVDEIEAIRMEALEKQLRRIAVVDDAIDTGATLECVIRSLRGRLPLEIDLRSAVITRTRASHRTLIEPDFKLYTQTLCRFPWSYDYKEPS